MQNTVFYVFIDANCSSLWQLPLLKPSVLTLISSAEKLLLHMVQLLKRSSRLPTPAAFQESFSGLGTNKNESEVNCMPLYLSILKSIFTSAAYNADKMCLTNNWQWIGGGKLS